jgi:hypothetical protein
VVVLLSFLMEGSGVSAAEAVIGIILPCAGVFLMRIRVKTGRTVVVDAPPHAGVEVGAGRMAVVCLLPRTRVPPTWLG